MPEPANPKLRVAPPPDFVAPEPQPPYAELAVTSNFSFLRGGSFPDELVFRAAELGYTAIAITDRNTLAGVVRAHTAAKQAKLKLIIGARLALVDSPDVLVWVTDRAAYGRLCRLLTLGKRRAGKGGCELALADLLDHHAGLLAAVVPPDPTKTDSPYLIQLLKDGFGDRLSLLACCGYAYDDARWLEKQLNFPAHTACRCWHQTMCIITCRRDALYRTCSPVSANIAHSLRQAIGYMPTPSGILNIQNRCITCSTITHRRCAAAWTSPNDAHSALIS